MRDTRLKGYLTLEFEGYEKEKMVLATLSGPPQRPARIRVLHHDGARERV